MNGRRPDLRSQLLLVLPGPVKQRHGLILFLKSSHFHLFDSQHAFDFGCNIKQNFLAFCKGVNDKDCIYKIL